MREPTIKEFENYLEENGESKNITLLKEIIDSTQLTYDNPIHKLQIILTHYTGKKGLAYWLNKMHNRLY